MKKVNKVLTVLFLTFMMLSSKAQTLIDSLLMDKVFLESPYIFEGTVLEKCYYKDPNTGLIFTNNIIEISKFIKGSLQCGTVSVVTEGGETADEKQELSHNTVFNTGYIGIFLCTPTRFKDVSGCPPTDNPDQLSLIWQEQGQIDYFADGINKEAEGFLSKFEKIQELYDFISSELGYPIIDCNTDGLRLFKQELAKNKKHITPQNVEDISGINLGSRAGTEYLKYTFSNLQITGHSTKNCEFDVKIEANDNSTFLGKGAFRIGFNTAALGTFIANNVSVSLDAAFDPAVYSNVQKVDKSDSVISIIIDGPANPTNRTNITTTKQRIVHISIPYLNCAEFPNIFFAPFPNSTASANNIYALSVNALSSQTAHYDSVILNDYKQGGICEPEITSIYENGHFPNKIVSAGTFKQMTLEGNHFLSHQGKLFLRNADNGGLNYLPLDNYDIQDWNDTSILFTLPSLVDSAIFQSGSYNVGNVGSGVPFVKNTAGLISDSFSQVSNRLEIPFSAYQISKYAGTPNYYKDNTVLLTPSIDSDYTFIFNTNVPQPIRACVKGAINRWRCATGVNFKLDETTTTTDSVRYDWKNVISVGTFAATEANTRAGTYRTESKNCDSAINKPFPMIEMDIKINLAKLNTFFYDSTGLQDIPPFKADFFAIILHELGHAQQLQHVINPNDLLHHTVGKADSQSILASNRKTISFKDQRGGDYVMSRSTNTNYGFNCIFNTPMAMQDTFCRVSPNGIKEVETTFEASVYPNPFTTEINVRSDEPLTSYILIDLQGKIIKNEKIENVNEFSISTNELSNGIYFIQLNAKHKKLQKKIVCVQ